MRTTGELDLKPGIPVTVYGDVYLPFVVAPPLSKGREQSAEIKGSINLSDGR